ncbi:MULTISPECIES: shikimate kinase AroL [Enterobacteriaceae]|uniref:shikimate kinase AroL n=1 Tax=Enterobacteriaceae TaxID=543 RepID=UPI00034ED3AD|nr:MULTISPECIES: shikimate kinase AroL [Enterobacteriaceae]AGN87386.1 shikimate kinase [Enterobacter sp. R4-368]PDO87895.1 shikimate kinase II [Kosakonia sacchari]QHM96158.1 shikimate kinase AroL [Kosakonia sacchari]
MTLPIFLIGARGCGKTTVGRTLALAQGCQFIDTDYWLQENAQQTIAAIVEQEGWDGFRARETAALEAVSAPSRVVATGGGIILREYNRRFMREHGVVIYLCAPVDVLADRLEAFPEEGQRPTLTGKPISEEVSEVLAQRDALYREAAHYVVDAAQSPDKVVSDIEAALQLARAS